MTPALATESWDTLQSVVMLARRSRTRTVQLNTWPMLAKAPNCLFQMDISRMVQKFFRHGRGSDDDESESVSVKPFCSSPGGTLPA
jgi:hypothetical protein